MSPATKAPAGRRLAPDARREQLLDLASERFAERSYEEVSIDEIARAAGVSKVLLYHYFPSKRELYVATVEAAAAELLAATEPPPGAEPIAALRTTLEAYVDQVERHAGAYAGVMRGGLGGADAEVLAIADRVRDELTRRIIEAISPGRPSRELRLGVRGWQGYCEAVALDWVGRRQVPRDRAVALMMAVLGATLDAAGVPRPDGTS